MTWRHETRNRKNLWYMNENEYICSEQTLCKTRRQTTKVKRIEKKLFKSYRKRKFGICSNWGERTMISCEFPSLCECGRQHEYISLRPCLRHNSVFANPIEFIFNFNKTRGRVIHLYRFSHFPIILVLVVLKHRTLRAKPITCRLERHGISKSL